MPLNGVCCSADFCVQSTPLPCLYTSHFLIYFQFFCYLLINKWVIFTLNRHTILNIIISILLLASMQSIEKSRFILIRLNYKLRNSIGDFVRNITQVLRQKSLVNFSIALYLSKLVSISRWGQACSIKVQVVMSTRDKSSTHLNSEDLNYFWESKNWLLPPVGLYSKVCFLCPQFELLQKIFTWDCKLNWPFSLSDT